MMVEVALYVCTSCLRADRVEDVVGRLQQKVASPELVAAVRVARSDCLGPCDSPVALALQGEGRAAYLFAGVSLPDDLDDVVATCRTYLQSPEGWIADARPCGRLRFCLRARVPAFGRHGG